MTLTCNSGGGQPVSLENVAAVKAVCERYNKLLFIDSARVIENAYFIQQRSPEYRDWPVAAYPARD